MRIDLAPELKSALGEFVVEVTPTSPFAPEKTPTDPISTNALLNRSAAEVMRLLTEATSEAKRFTNAPDSFSVTRLPAHKEQMNRTILLQWGKPEEAPADAEHPYAVKAQVYPGSVSITSSERVKFHPTPVDMGIILPTSSLRDVSQKADLLSGIAGKIDRTTLPHVGPKPLLIEDLAAQGTLMPSIR